MVLVSEPGMPSPAEGVMRWASACDLGKWATEAQIKIFVDDIESTIRAFPKSTLGTPFEQAWPEKGRAPCAMMTVVHAACVLDPAAACPLLRRLGAMPGFDPECRTKTGITPMIVAVYNLSADRERIAATLLRLGANPNSPADAQEGPRGRVVQRKPALAHVFQMKTPLFNLELLKTRKFVDTDLAKLLIEAGAHCGASFQNRPPIFINERNGEAIKRFKDGHCLPYQQVQPSFGTGHVWRSMPVDRPRNESDTWLHKQLKNHGQQPKVHLHRSFSAEDTARQIANPDEEIRPSDLQLVIDSPRCEWDKQIKRELFTLLLCLEKCEPGIPVDLWPLILSNVIVSPCAGFYDAGRLELIWNRQVSPYINTGYVAVQSTRRTDAHDICDGLANFLFETHIEVSVDDVTLYAATTRNKCAEFADVAAALFGSSPNMLPASFKGILSRRLTYDGDMFHSLRESVSAEEMQHTLCRQFVVDQGEGPYNVYTFGVHIVKQTVKAAMAQVIRECRFSNNIKKAMERIGSRPTQPLVHYEAESVVNQWFAAHPRV